MDDTKDRKLKRAFQIHRSNSAQRGIEFCFTFQEWVDWWGDDCGKRGRRRDQMVMARKGDVGPYHPDNVYKCTSVQNLADAPQMSHEALSERSRARHARRKASGIRWHLEERGDGHPKSRSVLTPAGRFGSMALAAEHYGITRQAMFFRLRNPKYPDFRYEAG